MDNAVYKYTVLVQAGQRFQIPMPEDAHILHIDAQRGEPQIWALVDPDEAPELRTFVIVATGQKFDATNCEHRGTFIMHEIGLVWHVFEVVEPWRTVKR